MNTPQKAKPWKRRKLLVNPEFQLKLMLYIAVAVIAALTVLYLSNGYYFDTLVAEGKEIGLDESHPYYQFIQDQRHTLDRTYLAISFVVFTALMIFGLFISHRIAGPIYRIETYMQRVTQGHERLAPVRLRKGDFFPEIAGIVNRVIDHLSENPDKRVEESPDDPK